MMQPALYSIVVPVYKSERSLRELYERIDETFENVAGDWELIMVEDGGGDGSWQVMQSLRERDRRVKIVQLTRNFGQHNALMCGLSFASGDYVITIDDDLQNPPEEIPKLIDAITTSGCDAIFAVPRERKHSAIRNAGSRVFGWLIARIFEHEAAFRLSNFRIIRKLLVDKLLTIRTPSPAIGPLLLNITDRVGSIAVEHRERPHGETTYTPGKLIRHVADVVLYHSTLPLRWVFYSGLASICFSFVLGGYYLTLFMLGRVTVPGWITLLLLLLFFFGTIMFSLGLIGEYLLRITQEVKHVPQYMVREKHVERIEPDGE
jgi:dolichol-phosphate mannosyltransferase/undecaprenyl-phosphate 4-deoxy-4-formamido-L-arabinose transferase